jgi:hypothetical protein
MSCATGSLARRRPIILNLDDDSSVSVYSSASKRQYNSEEKEVTKEVKKVKLTIAEGVNRVAEEMRESRILRQELAIRSQELATRTTIAIQLLNSRYFAGLTTDDFVKATLILTDPKNAEVFLALKDSEYSQETWLRAYINKE